MSGERLSGQGYLRRRYRRKESNQREEGNNPLLTDYRALAEALCNNASEALFITDERQYCVYLNAAAESLTGYSLPELGTKPLHDFIHHTRPDGTPYLRSECPIHRSCPDRRLEGEEVFVHRDGHVYTVAYTTSPIERDGRPMGAVLEACDITEAVRAEAALRDSEERFRALVEPWAQAVWETNADGVAVTDSPGWRAYTGQALEEWLGHDWTGAIHPDERGAAARLWREAVRSKIPVNAEFRLRRAAGGWRWTNLRAAPLCNPDGSVRKWVGMNIDITKRRQAEERLRQSERSLALLVDNLPDVVARFDKELRHTFMSHAITRHTGLPPEAYLGKTKFEVDLPPDLGAVWDRTLRSVLTDGKPRMLQFAFTTPTGEVRHHESRIVPEFEENAPPGSAPEALLVVIRDVTDRMRAEEALREADRRKDEFLAMLGHELRNPLGPILNAVEILQAYGPGEPLLLRQRDIIERQTMHIARLVSDLLDVSRIKQGKLALHYEPLDLVAAVRGCVGDYTAELERRGIRMKCSLPQEPLTVRGDLVRLCQAIGNLLGNAAKFTPSGGEIRVDLYTESHNGRQQAVIQVSDTGPGIPEEILSTLWEPYVQGPQEMVRGKGGMGLGLALVKWIAEMHGGTVAARNAAQGAEFYIYLPTEAAPAAVTPAPRPEPVRKVPAEGRMRVLVIDDNRDAAETLAELLELEGYEARAAFTSPEGIETARTWKPSAVLCDIGLPEMDGYVVAEALRRDPEFAPGCLIAMSGYARPEDELRSRAAGFDYYLAKPVAPETLLRLLHAVIGEPRSVSQAS